MIKEDYVPATVSSLSNTCGCGVRISYILCRDNEAPVHRSRFLKNDVWGTRPDMPPTLRSHSTGEGAPLPWLLEKLEPAHHLIEGPVALPITAIPVVDLFGTIKTDTYHKVVFLQEPAPFVVEECPVGLQRICYCLALLEWLLQIDNSLEEINPEERRLAALPDKLHGRSGLGGNVVGDEGPKHIIGHPVLLICAEESLFFKIKAVLTVKVAGRPDGLSYDVNALRNACLIHDHFFCSVVMVSS